MWLSALSLGLSALATTTLASPLGWQPEQIPLQQLQQPPLEAQAVVLSKEPNLVPLTLGVMSRCPDAHACEATMDRVFGAHTPVGNVRDLIEPELLFIGKLNHSATPYGVECMHGPSECRGNVQQLCMIDQHDWKVWWPFVQCLRWSGSRIGDDSLARQCASLNKINWDDVQGCVDGPRGAKLLQASVRNATEHHITTSCSVLINDRLVCVRDGGVWKDCQQGHEVSDFSAQIARAYQTLN